MGRLGDPLGPLGALHGNPLGPLGAFWGHWEGLWGPNGFVLGQTGGKMRLQSEPKCELKRDKIEGGISE